MNDPRDPGGETKYGISKRAYPSLDIASLTLTDAQTIYQRDYWAKVSGDSLPWPFALLAFDSAVNQGVGAAIQLMQTALIVSVDGVIGPHTLAAAQASTVDHWAAFMNLRQKRYAANTNYSLYGSGWNTRLFKVALSGNA